MATHAPRRRAVPPEVSSARKYKAWELRIKNPHMTFREITKVLNELFPAYPLKSDHQAVEKMIKEAEREYIDAHQKEVGELDRSVDPQAINALRRNGRQKSMIVYLIRAENGLVKIGKTYDVAARLQALDIGSPVSLELVYVIETQRADEVEQRLHGIYEAKRVKGEWFALSDEDIQAIIQNHSSAPYICP